MTAIAHQKQELRHEIHELFEEQLPDDAAALHVRCMALVRILSRGYTRDELERWRDDLLRVIKKRGER